MAPTSTTPELPPVAAATAPAPAQPAVPPNVQFQMPEKAQVNGKGYSSLTDDERNIAFQGFIDQWNEANKPAPHLDSYSDPTQWAAAKQSFNSNPLAGEVKRLREQHAYMIAASSDPAEGKRKADALFASQSQEFANKYMVALDLGAKNPEVEAQRQGALRQLIGGDIPGAIQAFAMTMPPVVAFIRSVTSGFFGEKISYKQARQDMRLEEAYGGLAMVLKADKEQMITSAKSRFSPSATNPVTIDAPQVIQKTNTPVVPAQESNAKNTVTSHGRSGGIKIEDSGTMLASLQEVDPLDALTAPAPATPAGSPVLKGMQGKGWSHTA